MDFYSVFFLCDECGDQHRICASIGLDDGPEEKASIRDVYADKKIDSSIVEAMENTTICRNTGSKISPLDETVFLVPTDKLIDVFKYASFCIKRNRMVPREDMWPEAKIKAAKNRNPIKAHEIYWDTRMTIKVSELDEEGVFKGPVSADADQLS